MRRPHRTTPRLSRVHALALGAAALLLSACGDDNAPAPPATSCDPACGEGEVCTDGACVPEVKVCDPACGEGEVCTDGACVPAASPCQPACGPHEACVEHQCVPVAPVSDACVPACGAGLVCVGGACTLPDGPAACEPTCEAGYRCEHGACIHPGAGAGHDTAAGASWTVLVYLVGDNDLEEFAVSDLTEMLSVGGHDDFKFVVQVDRSTEYSSSRLPGLGDWSSAKRLVLQGTSFEEVADLGEVDMADPAVLADFVSWGVQTYPADRRMIVFWDHGGGWTGFGVDEGTPGHPLLNLRQLKQGLSQGLAAADLPRFDVIGFDACLMANVETATVLAPFGEYLLASEEVEPGHGWNYEAFAVARDNPAIAPEPLLAAVLDGFFAQATDEGTAASITLSLMDLTRVSDLSAAIASLAGALHAALPTEAGLIGKARAEVFGFGAASQPEYDAHLIDVGDLLRVLTATAPGLGAAQNQVLAARLDDVVLVNRFGPIADRATGLTAYFPPASDYYNTDYDTLTEVASWRNLLRSYYQAGSLVADAIDLPDAATVALADGIASVDVTLSAEVAAQVTSAVASYGVVSSDGSEVYLLYQEPAWWTSDTTLSGAWDGSTVIVAQGGAEAYGFAEFSADANGQFLLLSIPFAYQAPGAADTTFVQLRYTYDGVTGEVYSTAYYQFTEVGVGELLPEAGSTLLPLIPVLSGGELTWSTTAEAPYDATVPFDITFDDLFADLASGAGVYLEIAAWDYAGHSDVASGQFAWVIPCGDVTWAGECQGDTVVYCEEGALHTKNCTAASMTCGYVDTDGGYFDCL